MADIYNPATWHSATKRNAVTDAIWEKRIAEENKAMKPIERAARALCIANGKDPDKLEPGDLPCTDAHIQGEEHHFVWRHYVDDAHAVLMAIREPSEVMQQAGWEKYNKGPCVPDIWKAMIDAALEAN